MNTQKIVGLIALVIVVVSAFVNIPYAEPILLVLGVYTGFMVAGDAQVPALVSALVLNTLVHIFDVIPGVGHYLVSILSNLGIVAAGGAVMIVLRNVYTRVSS